MHDNDKEPDTQHEQDYKYKVNLKTSILVSESSYVKYNFESALHFDVTWLVWPGKPSKG